VRRTAIYLESQDSYVFAWLHTAPGAHAAHGVVLCPPIGYEQVHAHRSLRHLADAFARAGLVALRLDYHGTGDSPGTDANPNRRATWLANIADAVAWLRKQHCVRVSLFGLRLGASLAVAAAGVEGVDALILWAPVLAGRSYVREMKALSAAGTADSRDTNARDIEAGGFILTPQTAADLADLDLRKMQPRCRHALVVLRDDLGIDTRLCDHLRELGITTEQMILPGFADMLAEPHYTRVPVEAIVRTVAWQLAATPSVDVVNCPADAKGTVAEALILPDEYEHEAPGAAPALRECPLTIGANPELFGIVTEPAAGPAPGTPLLLFVNAGSAYRVGPGRLYVQLTRGLAGLGFRCVRMDLTGLGDSILADASRENAPYPSTMFRDIDGALTALAARFGVSRVVLVGLCSGAYAAFQSAVQLPHPALVESVMINPLTFYWQEGMSLEAAPAKHFAAVHYYLGSALEPSKWWKLFSGQTQIGLLGSFGLLTRHLGLWSRAQRASETAAERASATAELGHPQRQDLRGDLAQVEVADRRLTFFFAKSDPGYGILMFHAQRKVKQLLQAGTIRVTFIDDADHTFSRSRARMTLLRELGAHFHTLRQQHG
jgi:alpha-beta hydrolase superfamily lysophospholipase